MTELFNRAAKNNCFDNGFNYLSIYSKMKKKNKDPSYQDK